MDWRIAVGVIGIAILLISPLFPWWINISTKEEVYGSSILISSIGIGMMITITLHILVLAIIFLGPPIFTANNSINRWYLALFIGISILMLYIYIIQRGLIVGYAIGYGLFITIAGVFLIIISAILKILEIFISSITVRNMVSIK